MARGWESKSVEAQMEDSAISPAAPTRRQPTGEELERGKRRTGLLLARQHVLQQLAASGSERYSEMLRRSLADLDKQIASLAER